MHCVIYGRERWDVGSLVKAGSETLCPSNSVGRLLFLATPADVVRLARRNVSVPTKHDVGRDVV